jgi:hypothetical protein
MSRRGEERYGIVEKLTNDPFEDRFLQCSRCILRSTVHIALTASENKACLSSKAA